MPLRVLFRLGAVLVASAIALAPAVAQDVLRVDGTPIRLVGDDASAFAHPAWSPDGTRIAFTSPGFQGLWVVQPDGQAVRQVTDEPAAGFGFAWSPDGEALLTRVARFEGPRRLNAVKVFDLTTGEAQLLTDYRARMPALPKWSADGTEVILPLPDGVELLERTTPSDDGGERLGPGAPLYAATDDGLTVVRLRTDGARTEQLLEGRRVLNAVASPDRSRVAFEVMGGNLHVMNADGTGLIDLGPGHRPTWSPSGRWVAFMRTEDDGEQFTASDLYAVRADGGETVALTQTVDRLEMNPSWSPDGTRIAFDVLDEGAIYLLPLSR